MSYPKSELTVRDHQFEAPLENVGHGLQRAVLFSVLEFMARDRAGTESEAKGRSDFTEAMSDILLLIEEPEIFQHPMKQRLFRQAFQTLTKEFNQSTGIRIQIIYTTHSPLMVDIRDFDEVCLLRRCESGDLPAISVKQASIKECAEAAAKAKGVDANELHYRKGLHIFTPQIAEGFFAQKVMLVEGVGDQAVMMGYYKQKGRDSLAEGIHIADASGKTNFDKPVSIFQNLGIPVFGVFDSDANEAKQSDSEYNIFIQRMFGSENPEPWPSGCFEKYAAFDGTLEDYIKSVVGEAHFNTQREQVATFHGVKPSEAFKTPLVASILFGNFAKDGYRFELLDQIVEALDRLS